MMHRVMLKSKIHRATVTRSDLHYEGSLAIDAALLEAADLLPGEQIHVYNVSNGERFVTYAIRARRNSGIMLVNGAAARLAQPGDTIIIAAYAQVPENETRTFHARKVLVDARNRIVKLKT